MVTLMPARLAPILLVMLFAVASPWAADDGQRLLSLDHYVRLTSNVPAITGQLAQIYVRERVSAGVALRGAPAPDRVVLFVHGAGTPAEVAFDASGTHSWMAYLAQAGFDVSKATSAGVPAPCTKSTTRSDAGAPRSATPALTRSRT